MLVGSVVMAHSRSWGLPWWAWTRRARVAIWRAWSALMACSVDRVRLVWELRTIHWSPVAWPVTSRSPRPRTAVMTTSSRSPVNGLALKATPAASAGTITWTSTAIPAPDPELLAGAAWGWAWR
jgi:hypothetical protein